MEALRLFVVLILIIVAIRKKVPVGITLFGAGIIIAFLFQLKFNIVVGEYWNLFKSDRFISLTFLVIVITILGALLQELKFLDKLADSCRGLPGGSRIAVTVIPGLVGLMPMPGGALMSAPLVNNLLNDKDYPSDLKMVINYWFRHAVEIFWPIYAGMILTEAITGLPIYKVTILQFPLYLFMMIGGLLFFIKNLSTMRIKNGNLLKTLYGIVTSLWPIILAVLIYGIIKLDLIYCISISIIILIITSKPSLSILKKSLFAGISISLIFLIYGILSFQKIIELTGIVKSIPNLAVVYNFPPELIIFLVCFTIGMLTGTMSAYIGLGYSILANYLYHPTINASYIFIAFFSGYSGFIFSPSHLCLILTNQYFKSDLIAVYKRMIPPFVVVTILVIILYYSGWGKLF
jgi:integral membrane protein (TIGR00529 family)